MKIVVINGAAGVGKDTFVEMCGSVNWVVNISSVDEVKNAARVLGWDGVKDEKGRQFLSDLKDMSTELYNGPLNYMKSRIQKLRLPPSPSHVFLHIREPQEIKKLVEEFPEAMTILVVRRSLERFSNHADAGVENYPYDRVITNEGSIEDLSKMAIQFMREGNDVIA